MTVYKIRRTKQCKYLYKSWINLRDDITELGSIITQEFTISEEQLAQWSFNTYKLRSRFGSLAQEIYEHVYKGKIDVS